ncbi:MAG: 1-acyl-sn-glycerol-3-phosphate acyltransferase [Brumimicrobium sp.]|nr:1-acyl-sn-glycerol-3-phosphate acyltransferase [Brumimicrobium sp.]
MRPFYFLLKFILKYTLWIYYPRFVNVNKPKKRFARTIFASNHAASFMDPLVVASSQPPIVFFMTRSDVFTPLLKPILWASHMFPIYREHDGGDTKSKNQKVFEKCYRVLKNGRSLLIFSEGFTDDVFIRRLKPIKKGAVRIGFGALENINWRKNIYLQAVGVNYSDPNKIGSDVVISNSDPICLNDYKAQYEKDPNKTIYDLTQHLEREMQAQITDIRKKEWAELHENVMRLTRKGMNPSNTDKTIPLIERWKYSKRLADWLNNEGVKVESTLEELKTGLKDYFSLLKKLKIEEEHVYKISSRKLPGKSREIFSVLLLPIIPFGLLHNFLPYILIKRFVEKSFRRKVFWGSVKMMLGTLAFGFYNILFIFLGYYLIFPSWLFWMAYYFIVPPLSGIITYNYFRHRKDYKILKLTAKRDISKIIEKRDFLYNEIKKVIPVA